MEVTSDAMVADANTQRLVQSVDRSKKFLRDIKDALTRHLHNQKDDAVPWLREINQVEQKGKPPRVIIGVVGATGSGKSSIINAILGEKQLVPTNCMRACTAVVTEISYNESRKSDYRAIIEFVSRQEWQHELELLLGDIIEDGKVTADIDDDDSEAGIAFAKVQAVYPHITKRKLPKTTVAQLLDCDNIKDVLDGKIEFITSTAEQLHERIQKYVDSKDKLIGDFEEHDLQTSSTLDRIAYWPLIRTVRVYTKSPVLRAGSVLVDLPGVADSNAARAAVAQRYLQNCDALWVVAPIIRAVDEKAARYLIDEGFKRQLWRDGTIQRITFICSKIDEISISEARAALERCSKFRKKFEAIDDDRTSAESQRDILRDSLAEVRQDIERVSKLQTEAKEEETAWKKLQDRAKDAEAVYPLVRVETPKRKLDERMLNVSLTPTKKPRYGNNIMESSTSPSRRESGLSSSVAPSLQVQFREDAKKPRLNLSQIKKKLENSKSVKSELRGRKRILKEDESRLKEETATNKTEMAEIRDREWITCVLGRNEISSSAIRADFAAGLRDIAKNDRDGEDHYDAFEEDDVSHTGSDALPVFCVSARGYHKATGVMKKEKIASCFDTLHNTGIPGLGEHIYNLGNDKKIAALEVFVDEVQRLSTSLRLWSSGDSTPTEQFAGGSEDFCAKLVDSFISDILETANSTTDQIVSLVGSDVLRILPDASKSASNAALSTSMKWVASRKADKPGLYYGTFKAIVKRNGSYAKRQKIYDFNMDLLQPFMRTLDNSWNDVFNIRVDRVFRNALQADADKLDNFTKLLCARLSPDEDEKQSTICAMFDEQVKMFTKSLGTVFRDARKSIEDRQKGINRQFEASVKQQMQKIYQVLGQDAGLRVYERCKQKMHDYLDANKEVIFEQASKQVTNELDSMLGEVRGTFLSNLKVSCDSLRRDCEYLSQKSRDFEALPEAARNTIIKVLENADTTVDEAPVEDEMGIGKLAAQHHISDTPDDDHAYSPSLRPGTSEYATTDNEQVDVENETEETESSDDDSEEGSSGDEA